MQSRRQFISATGAGLVAAGIGGLPTPALAAPAQRRKGHLVRVSAEGMVSKGRPVPEVTARRNGAGTLAMGRDKN